MLMRTGSAQAFTGQKREAAVEQYIDIDVSLEESTVCLVDCTGRILKEAKVSSEPEALLYYLAGVDHAVSRLGMEVGPL